MAVASSFSFFTATSCTPSRSALYTCVHRAQLYATVSEHGEHVARQCVLNMSLQDMNWIVCTLTASQDRADV